MPLTSILASSAGWPHAPIIMCTSPTYSSWLNQVEIWFNVITQKAIRRGTFGSVKELVAKIERFVHAYNANAQPFSWTATPDLLDLQFIDTPWFLERDTEAP